MQKINLSKGPMYLSGRTTKPSSSVFFFPKGTLHRTILSATYDNYRLIPWTFIGCLLCAWNWARVRNTSPNKAPLTSSPVEPIGT